MISKAEEVLSIEKIWEHEWKEQLQADDQLREWAIQWTRENPASLTIDYRRCFRGKKPTT